MYDAENVEFKFSRLRGHLNRYYVLYVESRASSEAGNQLSDLLTFKLCCSAFLNPITF